MILILGSCKNGRILNMRQLVRLVICKVVHRDNIDIESSTDRDANRRSNRRRHRLLTAYSIELLSEASLVRIFVRKIRVEHDSYV